MKTHYLCKIKYPLRSMLSQSEIENDLLFIEHTAEQAIVVARSGHVVTDEVYNMLDKAGVAMIRQATGGVITDEQSRIFEKIMSAVQMNAIRKSALTDPDVLSDFDFTQAVQSE